MSSSFSPELSIVIPLYNEEKIFHKLVERIDILLVTMDISTEVVLINDGSTDSTADLIRQKCQFDERYQGLILSRNHGHQLALTAGLANARASQAIMVMDGDLQDPPELIPNFYKKFKEGFDVVYAIRTKRKEGFLKKLAYWSYYRLQRSVSNFSIPIDSGDFGLMSRRVVNHLIEMPEQSRYMRGLRSWVGFKQIGLEYEREIRQEGESNYSLKQLMGLAFNGIFNFSEFPIKFITRLGISTILISLIYLVYNIYRKFFIGDVPLGFTALIMAIVLFSGVQLISIGILGEYIVRIFFQVKNRPLYIISERIINKTEDKSI